MTAYELFDFMISTGNRIDVQWGLFITVHLAILGGVIYVDRPLRPLEKIGAMIVYVGFAVINFFVTKNQLDFYIAANEEISRLAVDSCCRDNILVAHAVSRLDGAFSALAKNTLIGSHFTMAVIVTLSVIFDKELTVRWRGRTLETNNDEHS